MFTFSLQSPLPWRGCPRNGFNTDVWDEEICHNMCEEETNSSGIPSWTRIQNELTSDFSTATASRLHLRLRNTKVVDISSAYILTLLPPYALRSHQSDTVHMTRTIDASNFLTEASTTRALTTAEPPPHHQIRHPYQVSKPSLCRIRCEQWCKVAFGQSQCTT